MTNERTDGPLSRWISEYAKEHMYEREDRRNFHRHWKRYRKCRNEERAHGTILFNLFFDPMLKASLALGEGSLGFQITLSFGSEDIPYLREWHNPDQLLLFATNQKYPSSILTSMPGTAAETIISLPTTLQQIIAGRKVLGVTESNQTVLSLDPKPW